MKWFKRKPKVDLWTLLTQEERDEWLGMEWAGLFAGPFPANEARFAEITKLALARSEKL